MKRFVQVIAACAVLSPAVSDAAYRVGPGDVLEVVVTDEPTLSGRVTIEEDGSLPLKFVGKVPVQNHTLDEITGLLTTALRRFLKTPSVEVRIAEYHSQKVYLFGAVTKPGTYVLRGEELLLDVLLEGGGGPTLPSNGEVVVLRNKAGGAQVAPLGMETPRTRESESITVDLHQLLLGGDSSGNLSLNDGDILYVPGSPRVGDAGPEHVTVLGEVANPGVYRLEPGGTALAAVLTAGSVLKSAALNRAKVIRVRQGRLVSVPIELDDIMKRGDKRKDVSLEPGDMIVVPRRVF